MRVRIIVVLLVSVSLLLTACSGATPTSEHSTTSKQVSSSTQTQGTQTTTMQTSQTNTQQASQTAQASKTTTTQTSQKAPANITTFSSIQEGTLHRFYFLIEGLDGRNVVADGHIQLQIFDDSNTSLYLKEFDVKASEYVDYQFKLTGQSIGKAYEWRVPNSDIKKGISSMGWGRGVLTFIALDGKRLTAEDKTIQIPVYTDAELKRMSEDGYAKSATVSTLVAQDSAFEVGLTSFGFFTMYSYGKAERLLRADLSVVAKTGGYFWDTDAKLIDTSGKQYGASYKSEFDGGQLAANTTRIGYILFENIPEDVHISKITVEDYVFDFQQNRAYTVSQLAEEQYSKSSVAVNQKVAKGVFEVTVSRAGFFSSDNKEYFRVDMQVTNRGTSSEYFLPSGMVILDGQGHQYEKSYEGTLDTFSQMYPGVTKGGYVLFTGLPKTAGSVRLVFELGHDARYAAYVFEYGISVLGQ